MTLSKERAKARIFVIRQAAGWIENLSEDANTLDDETGEPDPLKAQEARSLAKRLFAQANTLESNLFEHSITR